MSDFDDMNRQVIEEFRAKDGTVAEAAGGFFADKPILLLHTTGARTGRARLTPLMHLDEGDARYVFASKGGAPTNPHWYHNLRAHPEVDVEMGSETYPAHAAEVSGAERDRIYAEMARKFPQFADYQKGTTRTIPVIALQRS